MTRTYADMYTILNKNMWMYFLGISTQLVVGFLALKVQAVGLYDGIPKNQI